MNITSLFIKRPVLATVVSLLILLLGLRSLFSLPVSEFPKTQSATVTITTVYYGADPDVVAGFITSPIEIAVAEAQGIDYITSSSVSGISTVTATLRLNFDNTKALTEINTKVNSMRGRLPPDAQQPVLRVDTGDSAASMYLGFDSNVMNANGITDYLARVVQPKLQSLPGVQRVEILGARTFALRAWLDPQRLAAAGLTAQDVYGALAANNYLSAVGATKGQMVTVNLNAGTDLHSLDDFRNLVIKQRPNSLVRLQDVANVSLGAESYDLNTNWNGKKAIFLSISAAPNANLLNVTKSVREAFPAIQAQLPAGLTGNINYDATVFVNSSIAEVIKTLLATSLIVAVVIFLFLGSARSVVIPVVAMPLSIIGGFLVMQALGYTINLLTLLALVLAIGLVVDDAIIVVENVDRHIKQGYKPLDAALLGARELTGPIISITAVLIAVYIPIGFQGGLTGALFTEFAFTLAGTVAVSAVIALTLSPMLCSRFLTPTEGKLAHKIEQGLHWVRTRYEAFLRPMLDAWIIIVVFGFIIVCLIIVFAKLSKSELAPDEDQGVLLHLVTSAPTASLQQMGIHSRQVFNIAAKTPEMAQLACFDGMPAANSSFAVYVTKPWEQRSRDIKAIQLELQKGYDSIPGARVAVFPPPSLPGSGGGLPLQFVINTTDSFGNLNEVTQTMMQKAQESGKFYFLDNNLKIDKPQTTVVVDRDKAALLGLSMKDIGSALGSMLGGGYVNYFSMASRSYKVIPQVQREDRLNPEQLSNYYLRAANGAMIPASTVVSFKNSVVPESINHFQQLNSVSITGVASVPMGEALATLQQIAKEVLPQGYSVDYAGQSRQTINESSTFAVTLGFAIIIIFLVLAAQFESFRDPLIVMGSVPMAIFGAMLFIFEGAATLNIYTEVGLVTLVGLIAKHGILIVQFANDEQRAGKSKREAIESAAGVRMKPILMTTAAMALGVIPLVIASGAGAIGRNNMGIVIASGISIGTLFTLFVVPAMYLWLARDHSQESAEI